MSRDRFNIFHQLDWVLKDIMVDSLKDIFPWVATSLFKIHNVSVINVAKTVSFPTDKLALKTELWYQALKIRFLFDQLVLPSNYLCYRYHVSPVFGSIILADFPSFQPCRALSKKLPIQKHRLKIHPTA